MALPRKLPPWPAFVNAFPGITPQNHDVTSPMDATYNCIGHAADSTRFWWPGASIGGRLFWPPTVPSEVTLDAFMRAYETVGYVPCADGSPEAGFEKIVIYTLNGVPTHAAKALNAGRWSSKLGQAFDISHELRAVAGPEYGEPTQYMRRRLPQP